MASPIPKRIVLATHNNGKLSEFFDLLKPYNRDIVSAGSLNLPVPDETGTTFAENAMLKAKAASDATGEFAFSDDSGLCVNALGGDPGLYSADWAGSPRNFDTAMQRVQNELGDAKDRSAYFISVLALYWPDGHSELIEGRLNGTIAPTPRGAHGHGYDPIFVPEGQSLTFAEMTEAEKNKISHRGRATAELIRKFFA